MLRLEKMRTKIGIVILLMVAWFALYMGLQTLALNPNVAHGKALVPRADSLAPRIPK